MVPLQGSDRPMRIAYRGGGAEGFALTAWSRPGVGGKGVTMSRVSMLLAITCVVSCVAMVPAADRPWQEVTSAADFVIAYPERVERLFASLDLERPELAAVAGHLADGDRVAACTALLAHYREGDHLADYRQEVVAVSDSEEPIATAIVAGALDHPRSKHYQVGHRGGRFDWDDPGPHGNKQFTKRLHRQQYLNRLLKAHRETGNPAYLAFADRCLRDWLTLPDRKAKGRKVDNNIDHGIRLVTWARIFYGTLEESAIRPATRLLMLADLDRHARFLMQNPGDPILLNFSSITMRGLSALGAAWPELEIAAEARAFAIDRLRQDMKNFVYSDGVQKELAPGYHRLSAQFFQEILAWQVAGGFPVPDDLAVQIEAMFDHVVYTMAPDGNSLSGGDTGDTDLRERILGFADTYDRDDWRAIATYGEQGTLPDGPASRLYPWAGVAIMRNGWARDAIYLSFDIGPLGSAHGDPDKLHITLHAHGRPLLVDSGKFPYSGDVGEVYRWTYGKHSRGHNVVLIDDHSQAWLEPEQYRKGEIDVAKAPVPDDAYSIADDHDAFRGSVASWHAAKSGRGRGKQLPGKAIHSRGLVHVRDGFIVVVDHIQTDRPRAIQALWHFHPDCTVATDGEDTLTTDPGVGNLRIVPIASWAWDHRIAKGEMKPAPQGWRCGHFSQHGVREAGTGVYQTNIDGDVSFAWVLLPAEGDVPEATGALLAFKDGAATVEVSLGNDRWSVTVPVLAGRASVEPLADR